MASTQNEVPAGDTNFEAYRDKGVRHKVDAAEKSLNEYYMVDTLNNLALYAFDWPSYIFAVKGRPFSFAPVAFVTSVAVVVTIWYHNADDDTQKKLQFPSMTITLIGNALFFAIGFRTNSCYSRWWQARSHWGMMINRTRDIAGQAQLWIDDVQLRQCIIRYTVAFVYATMRHLRFKQGVPELRDEELVPAIVRLSLGELEALEEANHMPIHTLNVIRACVREAARRGHINDFQLKAMDENITSFQDQLGACEKILKTPFPFGYKVHLRTFMILWLLALPFVLLEDFGWSAIPVTFLMAYALTGLEQLGFWMAHPFGHDENCLPLETLCKTIHTNLAEIANFQEPNFLKLSATSDSHPSSTVEKTHV